MHHFSTHYRPMRIYPFIAVYKVIKAFWILPNTDLLLWLVLKLWSVIEIGPKFEALKKPTRAHIAYLVQKLINCRFIDN